MTLWTPKLVSLLILPISINLPSVIFEILIFRHVWGLKEPILANFFTKCYKIQLFFWLKNGFGSKQKKSPRFVDIGKIKGLTKFGVQRVIWCL